MKLEQIMIPCGDINLEGRLHLPSSDGAVAGAVVCHPHPLYGGDMDNNIVVAICDELVANAIAALRFNFRGVKGSGGIWGGGVKEQDDTRAALDFLGKRPEIRADRLSLVGYSFGGAVSFPVAQADKRVKALALVSPALPGGDWDRLNHLKKPKVVLLGDADNIVAYQQLKQFFTGNNDFHVIRGADHFWWGFENTVAKAVASFLSDTLKN